MLLLLPMIVRQREETRIFPSPRRRWLPVSGGWLCFYDEIAFRVNIDKWHGRDREFERMLCVWGMLVRVLIGHSIGGSGSSAGMVVHWLTGMILLTKKPATKIANIDAWNSMNLYLSDDKSIMYLIIVRFIKSLTAANQINKAGILRREYWSTKVKSTFSESTVTVILVE